MSSVIRSRGGGKAESPSSESTVLLDEAQQESLVRELEAQATKAAAVWRAVFGGGSAILGVYFLALAVAMASSPADSPDVWEGVRFHALGKKKPLPPPTKNKKQKRDLGRYANTVTPTFVARFVLVSPPTSVPCPCATPHILLSSQEGDDTPR